jgi:hypothetical protein
MKILMRKILHLEVMGPSLVVAISLDHLHWATRILPQAQRLISLQKNNLNLNYLKKNRRPRSVWLQSRTINAGVQSLQDTASESDAFKSSSSHFSQSSLLDNKKKFFRHCH